MSKKILLIAGVLLAAGSVAAISSPHFRGGQLRLAQLLDEFGDGDTGSRSARSGKRHRQMDADDIDDAGREEFAKGRRARSARHSLEDDALDMPPGSRERIGRRSAERRQDREDGEAEPGRRRRQVGRDVQASASPHVGAPLGRDDRRFARLDRNGDGFIDAKEFEAWAAERAAHASQRFFKRFDADGDGKVSRDEFRHLAKDRFANRDARWRRPDYRGRAAADQARTWYRRSRLCRSHEQVALEE